MQVGGGSKCSSSSVKDLGWWLAETVTPWTHARHHRTNAYFPSGWASLHTCVHRSRVNFSMGWKKRIKTNNYIRTVWDLNMLSNAYLTLGLAYQLLTNLQFRFLCGARVPLQELLSDGPCKKRSQKAYSTAAQKLRRSFVLSEGV